MRIRRISPAEAKQRLDEAAARALFDIRERGEYNVGHIPGSTSLPRRDVEFRLARLLPAQSVPVIVTGDGGGRDERAAAALSSAGCLDLVVLEGGFPAWAESGYLTVSGVNVPSKAFGERVHEEYAVPEITAEALAER
ncbi:MAG TPA: rhodanese-like domain-containing protein, partial [Candidatus Binatia bacterium]|nr:rhodanese-like domain-containing protein [Candidatus Binatia bacterium]